MHSARWAFSGASIPEVVFKVVYEPPGPLGHPRFGEVLRPQAVEAGQTACEGNQDRASQQDAVYESPEFAIGEIHRRLLAGARTIYRHR